MRDFTLHTLSLLLSTLSEKGYSFLTFSEYLRNPGERFIILRHDVDARSSNSLATARLENSMGISGTYYFRTIPESFDEDIIKDVAALGHEIGYHYEDVAVAKGDYSLAIKLFEQNLAKLRRLVPVETICMHGSPMTQYDNRLLWEKYSYRDYGIIGEPYLDLDYDEILYLTDTGRCWDGDKYSLRDKVKKTSSGKSERRPGIPGLKKSESNLKIHSTFDIIHAAVEESLPVRILMTLHPQRWTENLFMWMEELLWQKSKNLIKGILSEKTRNQI